MAVDLTSGSMAGSVDLAELIARLDEKPWSLSQADQAAEVAAWLGALAHNREFLADIALQELDHQCRDQMTTNNYSAQVLVLHRVPGRYFIRANFWPAADDPTLLASGSDHFSYHQPHDHNFDFLTVGYAGPGYRSRWFERDPDIGDGYIGAQIQLLPVEEGQLTPGRILHYRAHRDIHDQLPPDALSISINIIPESDDIAWKDQYFVDIATRRISGLPTLATAEIMLRMAAVLSPERGAALAEEIAASHPSTRMRWSAWRALIGSATDAGERRQLLARAASANCPTVAAGAERLLGHG